MSDTFSTWCSDTSQIQSSDPVRTRCGDTIPTRSSSRRDDTLGRRPENNAISPYPTASRREQRAPLPVLSGRLRLPRFQLRLENRATELRSPKLNSEQDKNIKYAMDELGLLLSKCPHFNVLVTGNFPKDTLWTTDIYCEFTATATLQLYEN